MDHQQTKHQPRRKKSCLACKKCVLNLVLHLRRSKPCQPLYDMELMEESKKADVKLKKSMNKRKLRERNMEQNEYEYKENTSCKRRDIEIILERKMKSCLKKTQGCKRKYIVVM